MKRHAGMQKRWEARVAAAILLAWCGTSAPAETPPPSPDTPPTSLSEAAQKGDAGAVRSLLDRGANPLEPDAQGQTPLALAFRSGSAETVALLLSTGSTAYLDPSLDFRAPAGPSTLDKSD